MKGLYIHIPFCKQKCKYCDFVSFQRMEDTADKYIDALKREAEQYKGEKIDTIFIGGGTPSILTPKQIEEVTKMCLMYLTLRVTVKLRQRQIREQWMMTKLKQC